MHFTSLDWAIVMVYLLVTLLAGLQGRKYVSGVAEYLVAGRELGTFIGVATLAATEIGTVTFMYYAEHEKVLMAGHTNAVTWG
jgi:solute:Na+ symporter, SSS family